MFDYRTFKPEVLNAIRYIGIRAFEPGRIEWLNAEQRARLRGKNVMTDERWQYRLLADRTILVEISYSWFIDHPLLGLTVWHETDKERDHEDSKACFTILELVESLQALNS